jgi:CMD domain protein
MGTEITDIIDQLAGIEPGSGLDSIRARRLQAKENAQKSYLALFEPGYSGDVVPAERYAVATFVAGVHNEPAVSSFYLAKFSKAANLPELVEALVAEIDRGKTNGPYGAFPAGPLSAEDKAGSTYHVAEDRRLTLGARLSAAIEHAHLLVFRPRDATPADLQALLAAGWSSTGIVTLSQLVAFLSFQVRSVVGLRTLGGSLGRPAETAARAKEVTQHG